MKIIQALSVLALTGFLALPACTREDVPREAGIGDALPDTFPVPGTGTDLPEGAPLPIAPGDTLPPGRQ